MKKILMSAAGILLASTQADAAILDVSSNTSSTGDVAQIIAAPDYVINRSVAYDAQLGFNEQRGVVLTSDLAVDGGTISKGQRVDSHMILLNTPGSELVKHLNVDWTFDGTILGVMSDPNGVLETASTPILGATGTFYESSMFGRGLEGPDTYSVLGNILTLSMIVIQPGDWIRVVTVSAVPVPATLPLVLTALGGLGFYARRRRSVSLA